jgi:hypothetical protein
MKITESQREILAEVYKTMRQNFNNGIKLSRAYICWNLVIHATGGTECLQKKEHLDTQLEAIGGDHKILWIAIEQALEGSGSMSSYVIRALRHGVPEGSHVPGIYIISPKYAALARLAWLERILETGEIA